MPACSLIENDAMMIAALPPAVVRAQVRRGADTWRHAQHACQHLADVVEDYGPAHGWTCFPFERMNGIMKDTEVNMHNIEETFMRVWTEQDHLRILPHLTGE